MTCALHEVYSRMVAIDDVSFDVERREIFVRERLGVTGTIAVPVFVFIVLAPRPISLASCRWICQSLRPF